MSILLLAAGANGLVAAPFRAHHAPANVQMSSDAIFSRRSVAATMAAALFGQVTMAPAQAECSKFSPLCGSLPDLGVPKGA